MDMERIYAARKRLQHFIHMTPLIYSALLNRELKKHIWLKLETQLPTGSFKPRPAFNSILTHLDAAREHGVIASSSGNFAQGVAYAARELGVSAMIVMTNNTSPYKIKRTKDYGAEVVLCGDTHQDRVETTKQLQAKTGRVLLHPYDSEETIAGDASIGLELSDQLGEKFNHNVTVLVPVSGGGLIAGIAFALKNLHPNCKIIGIQPENNGSLAKSFAAGQCEFSSIGKTIADGLSSSIPGEIPFSIIKDYVDDVVSVTEDEIRFATQFLVEQHKLVVEPSGAVPVAALFANKISAQNVVCIISGGNVSVKVEYK